MQEHSFCCSATVAIHSREIGHPNYANKIAFSNSATAGIDRLEVELSHGAYQ
jgi:hypothetical protein